MQLACTIVIGDGVRLILLSYLTGIVVVSASARCFMSDLSCTTGVGVVGVEARPLACCVSKYFFAPNHLDLAKRRSKRHLFEAALGGRGLIGLAM